MAIKLRKLSRSNTLKFIAFTLVVLIISGTLLQWFYMYNSNLEPEVLFVEDYTQSEVFRNELYWAIHDTTNQAIYGNVEMYPEPDYLYYISDGENEYYNSPLSDILKHEKYLYKHTGQFWEYGENTYKNLQTYVDENYTLYLVFTEDYMQERQMEWEQDRAELLPRVIAIFASIAIAVICIIYLIVVTGRKPEDDQVHLTPYMDRIYSDIQLGIILFTLFVWSIAEYGLVRNYRHYHRRGNVLGMNQILVMLLIAFVTGIATIICGVILLSLVRKVKARRLMKHSLIYNVFSGISQFIRSFFDGSRFKHYPTTKSLDQRQVIFTVSSGIMVFMSFVFLAGTGNLFMGMLPILVEALIVYWYFSENRKTYEEINQGFQISLQEQMKSERMKVDLITNVSHDLKTPLTSIISYVDLLSKEDLTDSAKDYVSILADKSERLKNIVSDLFDLAKSTSGNLPLNMENLDLRKLIEQTLGDMEDDIERSGIRTKTTLTDGPVHIYSDGKKLYRVFQNIIGNALQYSLQSTRVFIDMEIVDKMVNVTVKNTASYDMDFTAEDILQRFSRGDESRTTEGSGLGLSIAESFTWACGGNFNVEIDGDQFKVKLSFVMVENHSVPGTVPGTE